MKGPAIQLKHYLRMRQVLKHREWFLLLALAAWHGEWVRLQQLCNHPGHNIDGAAARRMLKLLQQSGLVEMRKAAAKAPPGAGGGYPTVEARITPKGMTFCGWPELSPLIP